MTHGIALRQNAAEGVPQHHPLLDLQVLPDTLDILDHPLQRIARGIRQAFRTARSTLIDQHQLTAPRQRFERGKKIGVIGAGAAVQQEERHAATQRLMIDLRTAAGGEPFQSARGPDIQAGMSVGHLRCVTFNTAPRSSQHNQVSWVDCPLVRVPAELQTSASRLSRHLFQD